jgi:hypothetical protein
VARRARDVFINCPFDAAFQPMFDGIVFAVIRSGFRARCALETADGAENRFSKIQAIVEECRFGIHDLSRTETDGDPPLPRFNMPLELGVFLGAKRYGDAAQRRKRALILDVERYRYQRFISDIAGQDIVAHGGDPDRAIAAVAQWLRQQSRAVTIPGGRQIAVEYRQFRDHALPQMLAERRIHHAELTFGDFTSIVVEYLKEVA